MSEPGATAWRWGDAAACAALAALLRLVDISQESLWADEFYTLSTATLPTLGSMLDKLSSGEPHPPIYFLIMRAWLAVAGTSDLSLRLPSVLFGIATIPLLHRLAWRLMDGQRVAALASACCLALLPMHIVYSQEARMYALQVLLVTATVTALAEAESRTEAAGRWRALSAIGLLAALGTHFFSLFVAGGLVAWQLLMALREPASRRLYIIRAGIFMAIAAPFAFVALSRLLSGTGVGWLPETMAWSSILVAAQGILVGPFHPAGPLWIPMAGIAAGLALMLLGTRRVWAMGGTAWLPVVLFAAAWALPFLISVSIKPIILYGQRYLVVATPWLALLVGAAFMRQPRVALALAFVMLVAQGNYQRVAWSGREKTTWDTAARFIDEQGFGTAPTFVTPARLGGLLERYGPVLDIVPMEADQLGQATANLAGRTAVVLCVVDPRSYLDAEARRSSALVLLETSRPGSALWLVIINPPRR